MNETRTLSQVCSTLEVSRRAVQGYESAGLVAATGKNKYGHLLYDARAQQRIKQIKLLQQIGFKLKEIKAIIDAPDEVFKSAVEMQIARCKLELTQKQEIIRKAEDIIGRLQSRENL